MSPLDPEAYSVIEDCVRAGNTKDAGGLIGLLGALRYPGNDPDSKWTREYHAIIVISAIAFGLPLVETMRAFTPDLSWPSRLQRALAARI